MATTPTTSTSALAPSVLRHAAQYSGLWAMEPRAKACLEAAVARIDLAAHVQQQQQQQGGPGGATEGGGGGGSGGGGVLIEDGIAVLEVRGTMTKYGSSLSDAPASLAMARTIRGLAQRGDVRGIVMVIDSPGGLVAGTDDLQRAVLAAREKGIATVAFCEDLCASAGYWLASGFEAIVANPGVSIGSIGAFAAFTDVRKAYEAAGMSVDVIASAPLKGAGTTGTSLSDEQRAEFQRGVDECAALFVDAIARGRGVSTATARAWADARMHNAEAAIGLGLIDEIGGFEDAMALCREMAGRPTNTSTEAGDTTMQITAPTTGATAAASIDEATMTDAALRTWLAEHRPGVLLAMEDEDEDKPEEGDTAAAGEYEDGEDDASQDMPEDEDKPAAADDMPENDGEDEDDEPTDNPAAPESGAGGTGPATIAALKAAGITDNAFIVGAVERGLTLSAATLAWEMAGTTRGAAATTEAHTNDPVGGSAGAVALQVPTGAEAGTAAAWIGAWDASEPLRTLAKAAGFRDKRTLAQFAAPEAARGGDVIAFLRKAAARG